ncbi:BadF/BadG/BcrA/BcrD ATPase family protein [Paraglaciecola sp.]|uniref:BadF/BadG/BcrA/BcrD ATPase family protein n=1 Tax=Paraglaciecola sp. TaxID=1920173 RepID=UPI003EF1161A
MFESNPMKNDQYYVGIDGGGTQCRASIYDRDLNFLGRGIGGQANPINGIELAQLSIIQSVEEAIKAANLNCSLQQLTVGAGLAGLHLPELQKAMDNWQHPFNSLELTTDAHCALLGAHKGQDGAVIILGTGFSALGITKERLVSIGGYGFPINASCSGAWFGLEMIKAVLLDIDKIGPKTSMTQTFLDTENVNDVAMRLNNAPAFEFAKYAPLVFQHASNGDKVANLLIKQGADFINKVIERFINEGIDKIGFIGGIAPDIISWLNPKFEHDIVAVKESPEFGAVIFAKNHIVEQLNSIEKAG